MYLGLILCLVFGAMILRSIKWWKLANELDRDGLITRATIIALWQERNLSKAFLRQRETHYVLYAFEILDQQQFAANQSVRVPIYKQLQVGSQVRVRFLPKNPNISRMETNPWVWKYSKREQN